MAPKRKPPVEEPLPASSSEVEETASSSEGEEEENDFEESSDEEQEEETNKSAQAKQPQRKPETEPHGESESDESESGSESDADTEQHEYTIKPVASKPIEQAKSKAKIPTSPPPVKQSPASPTPVKHSPAPKRGAQAEATTKESKRAKKQVALANGEQAEDETKTNSSQRVWSDVDEINLLEGLIRFKKEKGISDSSSLAKNMDLFFEFIKKKLHCDVSISQLKEKLVRLKKKYLNDKWRTSEKPRERQVYDLCQRVWGDLVETNGKAGQSSSKIGEAKAKAKVEPSKMDLDMDVDQGTGPKQVVGKVDVNALSWGEMEDFVMKRGLEFAEVEEKAEMEERWKNLHMKGLQLVVEKAELLNKQAKIALAAYRAGKYCRK
ncbi:hypothetical protein Tsubulata_042341 [Turnera subulata]|uniref:Glabrous enhancer-binding protein-like DBD domain-containing protein n=1 Tax=Turnera subulata TaxID=218843 RepID=A0A9Q0JJ12_9ROSI|nr:hypothetical protein Tsubulata_042341 [Turnera subulata]